MQQLEQIALVPTNWLVDVAVPMGGVLLTIAVTIWIAFFIRGRK
ncbi:hypothetical protein LCGC14_2441310 [marine sediment metagenome]|uniref:Uncharacterized protein n=1 Tax=marine sediment metagenome TaxID=412755 RepID=A0A0F9DVY4_9ZZZZ